MNPFYIAHRGSGDNWPEHTAYAYDHAAAIGARAIEVSVSKTLDGVFVCHHDTNTQRMTGQNHVIAKTTYARLAALRNDARAWLGPKSPLVPIPRLEDVLKVHAHRRVVFIEDKQGTNTDALLKLISRSTDATRHFVWKQQATSSGVERASAAGFTTWGYFGSGQQAQYATYAPLFDYLGIYARSSDDDIRALVAVGKPVVAWPVHNRSTRDRLLSLGVTGMMCSNLPYVHRSTASVTTDRFATGLRTAGDLPAILDESGAHQPTLQPARSSLSFPPTADASYVMGALCPVPSTYRLKVEARWPGTTEGPTAYLGIAFGQAGDAPYRVHLIGGDGGYHLIIRSDGQLQLFRRAAGEAAGTPIGKWTTQRPAADEWVRLAVDVGPRNLTISRLDGTEPSHTVPDASYRGRYFSLVAGGSASARAEFRAISVGKSGARKSGVAGG